MAPPTKLTQQARDRIIGALRSGADMALAATAAEVSRRTLFNWQAQHPDLAEQMADAKAVADDIVEKRLFDMTPVNVTACIFWLKNRRPTTWKDVHRIKIDMESQARKIAEENGLDAEELIRVATAIANGEKPS